MGVKPPFTPPPRFAVPCDGVMAYQVRSLTDFEAYSSGPPLLHKYRSIIFSLIGERLAPLFVSLLGHKTGSLAWLPPRCVCIFSGGWFYVKARKLIAIPHMKCVCDVCRFKSLLPWQQQRKLPLPYTRSFVTRSCVWSWEFVFSFSSATCYYRKVHQAGVKSR